MTLETGTYYIDRYHVRMGLSRIRGDNVIVCDEHKRTVDFQWFIKKQRDGRYTIRHSLDRRCLAPVYNFEPFSGLDVDRRRRELWDITPFTDDPKEKRYIISHPSEDGSCVLVLSEHPTRIAYPKTALVVLNGGDEEQTWLIKRVDPDCIGKLEDGAFW